MLVDANVLMYAAGRPHPHKEPSVRLVRRIAAGEVEAVVDAEVLQEVLHGYRALGRWVDGRKVFDRARVIFPVVLPITAAELDRARRLLDALEGLTARDALHAAVALEHRLDGIYSYDTDFDRIRGVRRREPS